MVCIYIAKQPMSSWEETFNLYRLFGIKIDYVFRDLLLKPAS